MRPALFGVDLLDGKTRNTPLPNGMCEPGARCWPHCPQVSIGDFALTERRTMKS
jgi:hypothetical protein